MGACIGNFHLVTDNWPSVVVGDGTRKTLSHFSSLLSRGFFFGSQKKEREKGDAVEEEEERATRAWVVGIYLFLFLLLQHK